MTGPSPAAGATPAAPPKDDHDPTPVAYLSPPDLPSSRFYSHAALVRGGQLLYVSGQQALDEKGQLVGRDDFPRQAEQVFANVRRALAAAGADASHVVAIHTHYVNRTDLPAYRDARLAFFAGRAAPPPASTTVQVPSLVADGALLEVGVTAVLPPPRELPAGPEPVTVVAMLWAHAGQAEQLKRALLDNAEKTRLEDGCQSYVVHAGADDPNVFVLYETWTTREALAAHFQMPYMKELSARRGELIERSQISILRRFR